MSQAVAEARTILEEELDVQTFNVFYDPSWHDPLAILDENENEVKRIIVTSPTRLVFVPAQGKSTVAFTNAQFFAGRAVHPPVDPDDGSISFTIQPPMSTLSPLIFSLVATVPAPGESETFIHGLRTAPIFVTLDSLAPPSEVQLAYDTDTGDFILLNVSKVLQPGQLLIFMEGGEMNITLVDQNGDSLPGLTFSDTPITWLSQEAPDWLTVTFPGLAKNRIRLDNEFVPGVGRPFFFMIHFNGLEFRSPDPIIINTTIGDG